MANDLARVARDPTLWVHGDGVIPKHVHLCGAEAGPCFRILGVGIRDSGLGFGV